MNVAQAFRTHFNCKNEAPINRDWTLLTFIEMRLLYAKLINASNALRINKFVYIYVSRIVSQRHV